MGIRQGTETHRHPRPVHQTMSCLQSQYWLLWDIKTKTRGYKIEKLLCQCHCFQIFIISIAKILKMTSLAIQWVGLYNSTDKNIAVCGGNYSKLIWHRYESDLIFPKWTGSLLVPSMISDALCVGFLPERTRYSLMEFSISWSFFSAFR